MSSNPDVISSWSQAPFEPSSVRRFRFVDCGLDIEAGRIELEYSLDDDRRFVEIVDLGRSLAGLGRDRLAALGRAVRLLHLVAGVSYYKSCFPPEIVVESMSIDDGLAAFLSHLYELGLAECRWQNNIVGRDRVRFPSGGEVVTAPRLGLTAKALVPVGGGKDSIVALEEARAAGAQPLIFSVGESAATERTAAAAGIDQVIVRRRISPHLLELNRHGAINGHVPVTAINSCIACISAILEDRADVVMANERSASVGSLVWRGLEVNHQYSKSWDFERRFAGVVTAFVAADLRYFSLLRPWSELAIARTFAGMTTYHHAFVSCNRAYLIDRDRRTASWCGDCPKCRFVFLALAPFLGRGHLVDIFGSDLLSDPDQIPGYAALLGVEADKPMECVGEIEESRVAMHLLSRSPAWAGEAVVRGFAEDPRIRDLGQAQIDRVFAPQPIHAIPSPYERFASALG